MRQGLCASGTMETFYEDRLTLAIDQINVMFPLNTQLATRNEEENYSFDAGIYTTWSKKRTAFERGQLHKIKTILGQRQRRNWRIKLFTEISICNPLSK